MDLLDRAAIAVIDWREAETRQASAAFLQGECGEKLLNRSVPTVQGEEHQLARFVPDASIRIQVREFRYFVKHGVLLEKRGALSRRGVVTPHGVVELQWNSRSEDPPFSGTERHSRAMHDAHRSG
jgi:hypothetical protein